MDIFGKIISMFEDIADFIVEWYWIVFIIGGILIIYIILKLLGVRLSLGNIL